MSLHPPPQREASGSRGGAGADTGHLHPLAIPGAPPGDLK